MATALLAHNPVASALLTPKVQRKLTLNEFMNRYAKREDGFKYEFNNGLIEKTPRNMNPDQAYIYGNLMRFFVTLPVFAQGDMLFPEYQQLTSAERLRKPDLSYVPAQRIKTAEKTINEFVIEIISPSDNINRVNNKILEYFSSGVQVVWHIFPEQQMVYVFTSPQQIKVCMGADICSAAPVIIGFDISVNDIFRKF
ncbi:MAG: Uma2 family endonuclease [Saprospiraceae bacterium]|nr:Uma2 family endonuclease [Saprospiraceae bacterium]